ncbi:MAG TPA: M14 family zinc carboxypeptidase [Calditrichia bacterium]|nr:hypothetical protein [Calditrichota bacterium]HQV30834.1 M14 family zinc carboxypeptidase [Calditrichia bacterium]
MRWFKYVAMVLMLCSALNAQQFLPVSEAEKCGFDEVLSEQLLSVLGDHWGYGYDSLLADLPVWDNSPYVSVSSIGNTVQNRPIWQLTITSDNPPTSDRRTVFIHARTHPNEVQAWWVTDEIINLLLSPDPYAAFLRENCVFYVIPMYNPDGVELELPRQNANNIDIESGWDDIPPQPEVAALRTRFAYLMGSPNPIEVALNMHSAIACLRYFVYHHENGTSPIFAQMERQYIEGIRSYFPGGIQPWSYYVSWTGGTPDQYPESWFWRNYQEAVMALTYEDMNCSTAGNYDQTAFAILHGVGDYLGLVQTGIAGDRPVPADADLEVSFPNPLVLGKNSHAIIVYQLDRAQSVRLALFDLLGRRVKTLDEGWREEGEHRIFVNGESLASGRYLYRLETAGGVLSRQLTIVK